MKTDIIAVKNNGQGLDDVLREAERAAQYQGLDKKQSLRLRLLAEEITGLVSGMVGSFEGLFWIEGEDKALELCLEADCKVDRETHDKLLEMASDGKNMATKGFLGKLRGIFEYSLMAYDTSFILISI